MQKHLTWEEDHKPRQVLKPTRIKVYCIECKSSVKQTKKDIQRREMPWCQGCDTYFLPFWELDKKYGHAILNFVRKTKQEKITDLHVISAIPENKKNDRPGERYEGSEPNRHQNNRENKKKAPIHKDVAGQILKILTENKHHFKTGELVQQIQASRQSIMVTLKKLVAKKQIIKIKHGVYAINNE